MKLPKYFNDLKLGISAITGEARIYKEDKKNPNCSDVYKTIEHAEFKDTILNYFSVYEPGKLTVQITDDLTVLIGGKFNNKKELIEVLGVIQNTISELEVKETTNE